MGLCSWVCSVLFLTGLVLSAWVVVCNRRDSESCIPSIWLVDSRVSCIALPVADDQRQRVMRNRVLAMFKRFALFTLFLIFPGT
jgi:hypothetical protein